MINQNDHEIRYYCVLNLIRKNVSFSCVFITSIPLKHLKIVIFD